MYVNEMYILNNYHNDELVLKTFLVVIYVFYGALLPVVASLLMVRLTN